MPVNRALAKLPVLTPLTYATKIAAEVKDFRPQDFMPKKDARRVELFIAYALAATRMAIEDSGLVIDSTNETRVGTITGCGLGGLRFMEDTVLQVSEEGPKRVSPFFIPMMIGNMAPGMISIHFGARGTEFFARHCLRGRRPCGGQFF